MSPQDEHRHDPLARALSKTFLEGGEASREELETIFLAIQARSQMPRPAGLETGVREARGGAGMEGALKPQGQDPIRTMENLGWLGRVASAALVLGAFGALAWISRPPNRPAGEPTVVLAKDGPVAETPGHEWGPLENAKGEHPALPAPTATSEDRPEVFEREGQIWIRYPGGKERQLTTVSPNHGNFHPVLSPDGTRVAFLRDLEHDPFQVMVLDVDKGEPSARQVTWSGGRGNWLMVEGSHGLHWRPDGKTICFVRFEDPGGHLWLVELADGTIHRIERGRELAEVPWALKGNGVLSRFLLPSLGSPEPALRGAAFAELRALGTMVHGMLYEAYDKASDPDVQKQYEELLLEGSRAAWKKALLGRVLETKLPFKAEGPLSEVLANLSKSAGVRIDLAPQAIACGLDKSKIGFNSGQEKPRLSTILCAVTAQAELGFVLNERGVVVMAISTSLGQPAQKGSKGSAGEPPPQAEEERPKPVPPTPRPVPAVVEPSAGPPESGKVTDPKKIKVLLWDQEERWEFRYLKDHLLRDKVLVPVILSGAEASPRFRKQKDGWNDFDVVVLGDIPRSSFTDAELAALRAFVAQGGGLIVMAGRKHMPYAYRDTVLPEILPVELQAPDKKTVVNGPFQFSRTPEGRRHPLLILAPDTADRRGNEALWAEVEKREFSCDSSLTSPKQGGKCRMLAKGLGAPTGETIPLVVIGHYVRGSVLFLGSDFTWRVREQNVETYDSVWYSALRYTCQYKLLARIGFDDAEAVKLLKETQDRDGKIEPESKHR